MQRSPNGAGSTGREHVSRCLRHCWGRRGAILLCFSLVGCPQSEMWISSPWSSRFAVPLLVVPWVLLRLRGGFREPTAALLGGDFPAPRIDARGMGHRRADPGTKALLQRTALEPPKLPGSPDSAASAAACPKEEKTTSSSQVNHTGLPQLTDVLPQCMK